MTGKDHKRRNFYSEIRSNNRRLYWVLAAYLALAVIAGNVTGRAFLFLADPDEYYALHHEVGLDGMTGSDTGVTSYVNQVTFAVLLLAWANYYRMRRHGDRIILKLAGARPLKDQQFINTSEEMAISAEIPAPDTWIIETASINAFACSGSGERASIAVTRGLLEQLSRSEIQAVVGHELTHIRNGDARLMTAMLGMGRAFHLVSAFALGPLRALFDASRASLENQASTCKPTPQTTPTPPRAAIWEKPATARGVIMAALAMPVLALVLLALSVALSLLLILTFAAILQWFPWLVAGFASWQILREHIPLPSAWVQKPGPGKTFSRHGLLFVVPAGLMAGPAILVLGILVPSMLVLMRLAVSRNREFQADAGAVKLTRNPGGLRSALEKIHQARVNAPDTPELPSALSPLTIVSAHRRWALKPGLAWLNTLLSTHPPLEERIIRLSQMEGFNR